ncbi:MAG: TonB-dependent receptor [Bacteroidota bacterium]|nr:TonB-dependent receptor [Bacteroidota bacterium]
MKNFIQNTVSVFLVLVLHFSFLSAGTTGKISGKVKNSATGEVLPGSTIVIEGTTLGAVGNVDGQYFIINIRPGTYSVRATMLGYKPTKVTSVVVSSDMTTQIDFLLEPTTVELEEKVVTAERPLFQKDNTAKLSVITADEFINMPVNSIQDVLTTKAGFTTDAEGEIHARGGRSGEIAYLIDGQYVKDPLYGDFNNTINKDAVQELSVVSGSFNAEYGEAMSSIVNVVTKEGEETYHGKMEYTSPMINKSQYRKSNPFSNVMDLYSYSDISIIDDISFDPLKLDVPIAGMINASLNGPIPFIEKLSFFISGKTKNEDSYLPHGYNLERDLFSKLTYRISPILKLSLSAQSSKNEYQNYSHTWKYLSANQSHFEKTTDRYVATLTHTLDADLFFTLQLSRFNNSHIEQVGNKLPSQYVRGQTGNDVYFLVKGDDSPYSKNVTATNSGKIDVTYQLNNFNQFKSGVEIKNHLIQVYEESEPWEGGAKYKDKYSRSPIEGSAYIQDKIEYDYLITNLGLRFDYVDPNATVWPDIKRFGYYDANNNWIPAPEQKVSAKTQLSPRIGLAHPITDLAVLHFSYGHFFQNPDYNSLYYNHNKDLSNSLPLLGNPSVKAQKTIAYETGIKYKLSDDFALEISGWYKDITDLLSTLQVSYLSQDYVVFYNSDYASVKGIDLTLNKRYTNYISGSINYTYMVAKGNNSQPLGGFVSAYTKEEIPHRENYLDFDQTHTFVINVSVSIPHDKGFQLMDMYPLADVNLSILLQASSGLPYTPYVDPSVRIDINSARKPWTSTVDLRASKKIWDSFLSTNLFVEITNLLDVENIRYVYSRTGKPFDAGDTGFVGSSPDAGHNPSNLGPPRIVKAGIQFSW